ncbi:MAG: BACON domain-containing protein, partial [Acidobacteria bacterium]|nr:BACON domain-containing protein [Acidobacteriota bacterium]
MIAFGQQISREYIRLGGRVIAIENYGSLEVTLSAPASRVGPGEQLLFNASGGGASNGVNWSLDPPPPDGGQITTPGGLYTAPSSISAPRPVTVKATSVADGTSSGTFSLTLNPALLPADLQIGASGGAGNVKVTKQGIWTATSSTAGTGDDWLRITSIQQDTAGGEVNFTVAVNSGGSRDGSLTIAGQSFGVHQSAADASIS